jgi:large subunit ribosomal protein L3
VSIGILGTKLGMTQIFDNKTGVAIPVTVVQAGPCPVTQVKTKKTDGYESIQVGYKTVKEKALNKPLLGHLAKAGVSPLRHLIEYRLEDASAYTLGQEITAAIFQEGDLVDVAGTTIGRGFSGYHKRGNMTHGSKNHRLPGSTGAGTTPGRVFPGKRMAGQYGATQVTIRKLSVVKIDSERNLILIKGAVPGKPGTLLNITPAKKFGK